MSNHFFGLGSRIDGLAVALRLIALISSLGSVMWGVYPSQLQIVLQDERSVTA